jgi:predicted nucleotidyltransferase
MKNVETNVEQIRQVLESHLPMLVEQYHVQSLGIFGSYVRQEQSATSDLDVLVTFSDPPSLLQFIALENYLSDLLGVQVDLVMRDALKSNLGQRILQEVMNV